MTLRFDVPEPKSDPALVAADVAHLTHVGARLAGQIEELDGRLRVVLALPAGHGQKALDRDQEIHRIEERLRFLRRFDRDLCLGRFVPADGEPVYVGRFGLADADGSRLLVDWRSPAAAPFFAATLADPRGLVSRRRYRWTDGRVTDFWDEAFTTDTAGLVLDDDSALLASLEAGRSDRMRDVLGTIAADQDAIIRADSRGTLVVDGGPGTGKTVVALHRAAYLLHTDPRLGEGRGGILVVGPHRPYLSYVEDVLPSLGEEGVLTCTLADLVPEGASARREADPEVVRLKAAAALVAAIEPAVALYEEPPSTRTLVATPWGEVRLDPDDWQEAFSAPGHLEPHNEARGAIWDVLVEIATDQLGGPTVEAVEAALRGNPDLTEQVDRAWTIVEPTDLVADLWSVPAYLRRCAPWLTSDEVAALQRSAPYAWTDADLPLLDAARRRLGDPGHERRLRRRQAELAARRVEMDRVVESLIESAVHDDGEGLATSLRQEGMRAALVDESGVDRAEPDALAGPFAHVVVDEAQELSAAQWQVLLARCPSRSFTVVGDRAQSRRGFPESWSARLAAAGMTESRIGTLSVNYRTPAEIMTEAEPVIRAALPDANVPTSIRESGLPVRHGVLADLETVLDDWLAGHAEGLACVIGLGDQPDRARVRSFTPELAKGLEFDLVVLIDPGSFGDGLTGAVDRYVAMTRATRELVILR